MTARLGLTGNQDMLLATLNRPDPAQPRPVVGSVLRLESGLLTAQKCRETATSLVGDDSRQPHTLTETTI